MAYTLKRITIRTDNSAQGMAKINELWGDIASGKIPLMFDSVGKFQAGLSPVSVYDNYENDENGEYDLTVFTVLPEFFEQMEIATKTGKYIKIETSAVSIDECAGAAWKEVWSMTASGKIKRAFSKDYESTVPKEYTKDGKAHCYLYISVERGN